MQLKIIYLETTETRVEFNFLAHAAKKKKVVEIWQFELPLNIEKWKTGSFWYTYTHKHTYIYLHTFGTACTTKNIVIIKEY